MPSSIPKQDASSTAVSADESLLVLAALERSKRIGFWSYDVKKNELFWSAGTYQIHAQTPEQFTPTVDAVIGFYAPSSRLLLKQAVQQALTTGLGWNLELELTRPDGTRKWVHAVSQAQKIDGRVSRIVGSIVDIGAHQGARDEEQKLLEHLDYQRHHDQLTGLPNRLTLESELTARLDQSRGGGGWLLHLDLDRFKLVNEACGYEAGDRLIAELAPQLMKALQPDDLLARLNGDKFAVLITALPSSAALRQAQALIAAVDNYRFESGEHRFTVSLSVGAVPLDVIATADLNTVLRQAETSCQVAKRRGGGRVTVYQGEGAQMLSAEDDLIWGEEILLALDENRFELYAQRIVCLNGQYPPAYEILLRLRQRDGMVALPQCFLPAARRYGLMTILDRRVIELVLAQCRDGLLDQYPCSYISVNLSALSYCDETFTAFLMPALARSAIRSEKLRFEMTESEAMTNIKIAQNTVETLHTMGFLVMLDDFGSGFTSFSVLRSLKVDAVKINDDYTRDLSRDPFNMAVVASICGLCEQLKLELIAEGIEDEATLSVIRQLKVQRAQGWLFHRAEPLLQALAGGVSAPACISSAALRV